MPFDSASAFHPVDELRTLQREPIGSTVRTIQYGESAPAIEGPLGVRTNAGVKIDEVIRPIVPRAHVPSIQASVIQTFEGTVLDLDSGKNEMVVKLVAKLLPAPDHGARISLDWVVDQDRDLVKPGAIFYLTLYKEITRGSIKNTEEIRFRRLPAWNAKQLEAVDKAAAQLKERGRVSRQID